MAETPLEKAILALGIPVGAGVDEPDYSQVDQEELDEILCDHITEEVPIAVLLGIDDIGVTLHEHFANQVLDRWEEAHEEDAWPERYQVLTLTSMGQPHWFTVHPTAEEAEASLMEVVDEDDDEDGGLVWDAKLRQVIVYAGCFVDQADGIEWALTNAPDRPATDQGDTGKAAW